MADQKAQQLMAQQLEQHAPEADPVNTVGMLVRQLDSYGPIMLHYPEPTPLDVVLLKVARWSGLSIIFDPDLNRSVQIFAPRVLPAKEAFSLLLATIEAHNLRVLQIDEFVLKVVPKSKLPFPI